ncbi:MAG: hypothetical protein QOH93_1063 [Chloroflexia bacterium]|jgi:hypothetical protein|nr:hypothetical protein [Chloroflexia bacterium]
MPPDTTYGAERPTGVTVLALLNFLSAGLSLLLLARIVFSLEVVFHPSHEFMPGFPQMPAMVSRAEAVFIGILGTVVCLPLAIGLWGLRRWARVMALAVYIGGVTVTLCANFSSPIIGSTLLSLAIGAGAVIYLLRPETIRAFGELPTK